MSHKFHTGEAWRHFVNQLLSGAVSSCAEPKIAAEDRPPLQPASSSLRGFSSSLQQNRLRRAGAFHRTVGKNLHRTDKAGRRLPGGSANVCTSRARALDFFAHKARKNPNKLGQSAGASSRR